MNTYTGNACGPTTSLETSRGPTRFHQAYFWGLSLIVALSFGCGRNNSTITTPDGEVKVSKDNDQVVVKSKDGEVTMKQQGEKVTYEATGKDGTVKFTAGGDGLALPDNFPKDIPIYKGSRVELSSSHPKGSLVHLASEAAAAEVLKFYQDELKKQGWEIETTMNMNDMSMLSAKKEKMQCSVVVTKQDKGTQIQLATESKE